MGLKIFRNKIRFSIIILTPVLITSSILGVIYYVKQTTTKKNITQDDAGLNVDENDDEIIATSRFDRNIKYKKIWNIPRNENWWYLLIYRNWR